VNRAIALLLLAGCGASPTQPQAPSGDPETAARRIASAREAWADLAPERAARTAEDAILLGARGEAQEIAARARLLLGEPEAAIRDLEGVSDPELLRLRARALLIAARWAEADQTLVALTGRDEEDEWTRSMRAIAAAMRSRERPYGIEGATETRATLLEADLPLVRVRVDSTEVIALIGTSAQLVVLDPQVRATSGAIDELAIEGMRITGVPHTVRDLSPLRDALHQDVRAVIGFQLLARLHATINNAQHTLTLRAGDPPRSDASTPLLTPSGAFLVMSAQIGEEPAWLSVDTAGIFPIALAPGAIEAFGLNELEWSDAGPPGVRVAAIPGAMLGNLAVEEIPVVSGIIDENQASTMGAPVAGSIGWMVLRELVITFDPETRRLRFD
jgi:hypothetical protein